MSMRGKSVLQEDSSRACGSVILPAPIKYWNAKIYNISGDLDSKNRAKWKTEDLEF